MKGNAAVAVVLILVCVLTVAMLSGCCLFKPKRPMVQPVAVEKPKQPTPEPEAKPTIQPTPAEMTPVRPTGIPSDASSVLKTIYFDFDKSNIRADQQLILDGSAKWLMDNPSVKILIEGHCDERGTVEYNFALGERRATSAKEYLVKKGIAPERVSTLSKGEEEPADPGHNEDAWAKNRRAFFKFVK